MSALLRILAQMVGRDRALQAQPSAQARFELIRADLAAAFSGPTGERALQHVLVLAGVDRPFDPARDGDLARFEGARALALKILDLSRSRS
jgi:hypothetical protein